jgi:DNA-binding HxlR family transcriptional regulator
VRLKVRKSQVQRPPMCALTQCMALLRGAWAPNVVWHLRGGARRFGELRIDIPLVSAKVLSARLRELEDRGVIARRLLASSPPSAEYELTALGRELVPALDAIVGVGSRLKGMETESAGVRPRWKAVHRPARGER